MTRRLAMILLLVSVRPGDSIARSQGQVVSLGHGVAWSRKDISNPLEGWLQVVTFDSSKVKVEVLARGTKETALPMHRWMTEENVIAGCNGGYFDPTTFAPAGLQVVQGLATGEYQQFGGWGGGFGVRSGKAQIWTEKEILTMRMFEAESFVQCSPVLVDGARRFTGTGEDVRARRTFIAYDGGPSSGLWGKDEMGKVVVDEKEMWSVKNCVVIRPVQK